MPTVHLVASAPRLQRPGAPCTTTVAATTSLSRDGRTILHDDERLVGEAGRFNTQIHHAAASAACDAATVSDAADRQLLVGRSPAASNLAAPRFCCHRPRAHQTVGGCGDCDKLQRYLRIEYDDPQNCRQSARGDVNLRSTQHHAARCGVCVILAPLDCVMTN